MPPDMAGCPLGRVRPRWQDRGGRGAVAVLASEPVLVDRQGAEPLPGSPESRAQGERWSRVRRSCRCLRSAPTRL